MATPSDPTVEVKLDKVRRLKKTKRSAFRLSKYGLTEKDFNNDAMGFYNLCILIYALLDEPSPTLDPESIAEYLDEDNVKDIGKKISEIVQVSVPAKKKTSNSKSGRSQE